MKKLALFSAMSIMLFTSCVSKKKFADLKQKKEDIANQLYKTNAKLEQCKNNKAVAQSKISGLNDQIKVLKNTNSALLNANGKFANISTQAAQNLERSLESLQEKDKRLQSLRDAMNRRDSVTIALVTSLKGALGNLQDKDIQVKVEKGVVFISISDKLLFKSGSFHVSNRAREVLAKVAKVVKAKPDIEFMVEGYTDNDPIHTKCLEDNWDLSVKRATSIVRILQNEYDIDPSRMTAAGRGQWQPVASNATEAGKALNRRTRIVVLPKLDKFYEMIENGMKKAVKNSQKTKG